MPRTTALVLVVAFAVTACETSFVAPTFIPGPPVPSVPTAVPYVWDSADELASWVNSVTDESATVVAEGDTAFLRVTIPARGYALLLRGPDLDPPCVGLRNVRMRYRWIVTNPGSVGGGTASGHLGSVQPVDPPWPSAVLTGLLSWDASSTSWQQAVFAVEAGASQRSCQGPCPGASGSVDARYVSFRLSNLTDSESRFEIDSIALVR